MRQDLLKNYKIYNSNQELAEDWEDSKIGSSATKQEEQTLTLESFGTDLTREAKNWELDPVIWRDQEIQQCIYTLLRKTKNNPLLIWEAGVGKTAIIEWLAKRIVDNDVPEKLQNKRVFMLDIWSIVAWTKYRWEFEARFKAVLEEAIDPTNNVILFIDEIHTIIWAWNTEWWADASNMLKPFLARWKLQLIWATTYDEYQKHIEKDAALKRRFQEVNVEEPKRDDAIGILTWIRERFEEYHWVNITNDALKWSVDLSSRYMLNKHLPDKAIDILDEACARQSTLTQKLKNNEEYQKVEKQLSEVQKNIESSISCQDYFKAAEYKDKEEKLKSKLKQLRSKSSLPKHLRINVDYENIWEVVSDKIWIPASKVNQSEINKLRKLDELLSWKVLGQEEAVEAVVKAIRRNRLSVIERNKPIASFLFLWPSWVGKTYIAKLLASEYFEDENSLIRVDMSEYMERHSSSKLIGSAPWYVGYEEWGVLTESVRRKPYSVVLFDEIEKASPEVLNVMLQILDEWRIKDNKWKIVDFKNTIIILTSNIWSQNFSKKVQTIWFSWTDDENQQEEKDFEIIKQKVNEELKGYLPSELINRLDWNIVFKPLSKDTLVEIFKMKYADFSSQWKKKKEVKIPSYSKKKIQEIIEKVHEPEYGARPLERYIYDEIEPQIIDSLLEKDSKNEK